jgi:hypothetical protein
VTDADPMLPVVQLFRRERCDPFAIRLSFYHITPGSRREA